MIAMIPACFIENNHRPYGDDVQLTVSAYSARENSCEAWDAHLRVTVGDKTLTLSLAESEMLETALRVARQSVRPKR